MKTSIKLVVSILLLLIVVGFLFYVALLIYTIMREEYMRYASAHMPDGKPINWQNFVSYPFHWPAAQKVTIQFLHLIIPLLAVILFTGRLFTLALYYFARKSPIHKRSVKILYGIAGLITAVMIATMSYGIENQWYGNIPVREMGFISSFAFILLPIWLLTPSRSKSYQTDR